MDGNCIKGLILIQLVVRAAGQNVTDSVEEKKLLKLTEEKTAWGSYHTYCHSVAGRTVFYSKSDNVCTPEITEAYDSSNLPVEYTAWINSYLFNSFTITVEGCYEVLQKHYFTERKDKKDIESCALSCDSRFDFIGWLDDKCYCVMDTVVSPVSLFAKKLSPVNCVNQSPIENGTLINLYKKSSHYELMTDTCPVVYYLGGKYTNDAIVSCEEKHKFICNNSKKVYNSSTWYNAANTCTNMSAMLIHGKEVPSYVSTIQAYWSYGMTVQELRFDKQKTQNTRCTALKREASGRMSFVVLNCATELPSLCLNLSEYITDQVVITTHVPTSERQYEETTARETSFMTSVSSVAEPETSSESTTSVVLDMSTKQKEKYTSKESQQEESNNDPIWIAVGIMVFVIASIVVIVLYCRLKKKNIGLIKHKKKAKQFRPNEVSSDRVFPQTQRYLPSVMTYPSGYSVIDVNLPSEMTGTVASVHNDDRGMTGVENVSYNQEDFRTDTDVNPDDDQSRLVSGSYLIASHTSDSIEGLSEKDNYTPLSFQVLDDDSDDDKYVSMKNVPIDVFVFEKMKEDNKILTENQRNIVQGTDDLKRDQREISEESRSTLSTTTNNGEETEVSPLVITTDNGEENEASPLFTTADNGEENWISMQSFATSKNKEYGVPLLSPTAYSGDNIEVSTLPYSAENKEEVAVSILRELINSDNGDLDIPVPLSGDRIDSIVFR